MPASPNDLTQRPPRSARVRLGGYAILPRCLDKGRATVNGKNRKYTTSVVNNSLSGVTVPTIYLGEEGKEEAGCP